MPQNTVKTELLTNIKEAVDYVDDVAAKKLIEQIDNLLVSQNLQQTNPALFQELQKNLVYLKIVAIPNLSDEQVQEIIRNYYINSFDIDISMENRLTTKLFFVPEIPRDELRKKLKKALLENQQKLGRLTVGQWIYEFEKNYPVQTRNLSASVDFIIKHPTTKQLDPLSRKRLKELLHTYDYLLVTTLPATGPVLEQILSAPVPFGQQGVSTASNKSNAYGQPTAQENTRFQKQTAEFIFIKLNLEDALRQIPDVGEQLITSEKIQLKNFPEPVRPSLKNWLADYDYTLYGKEHTPMERGIYLFQSGNGKRLNSSDRNKLAYVLKAYDEKTPVSVNRDVRQIIFSAVNPKPLKTASPQISNNQFLISNKTPISNDQNPKPAQNYSADMHSSMRFSSPQKLPYEKKVSQPYIVKPVMPNRPVEPNKPLPKNVVNLKDLQ